MRKVFPVLGFVSAVVLGLPGVLSAQKRNLRFDHLSIEQGLSQSLITSLFQDSRGFMWFGTEEGLNRYDGQGFTIYKNEPQNPHSISNSLIWAIHEDRMGRLWVGTYGGGVNLWDQSTSAFKHYRSDPSSPDTLGSDRVRTIYEDRSGTLWIGTDGGGLNRFDPEKESFSRNESLSQDSIRAIYEDRDGVFWVGTFGGGLARLDRKSGKVERYKHSSTDSHSLSEDRVRSILEDREGGLWVATDSAGLNRMNRRTGVFKHYRHDPSNPRSLSSDLVRFVFQDDSGTLWVGTEGGLNEWRPETESFVRYRNDPADPRSLNNDQLTTMFQDSGGVVWIGTMTGLNKWNPVTGAFTHSKEDPTAPASLGGNNVFALYEDRDGAVWVGMPDAGLDRLERKSGRVTHFKNDPRDPRSLSDDRVMAVLVDHRNQVWVATKGGVLNRLDRPSGTFTRFQHNPKDPKSLGINRGVMSLYEDREGTIWAGLFEGGLDRFDPRTETFVHYRGSESSPKSLSNNRVASIYEDSTRTLWVGTDGGGLNRFDRTSGTFTVFRHDEADPQSLSSDQVWSLHEDARGTLWIGTAGGGLNRWERADRLAARPFFKRYSRKDGLSNDFIYGILSDEKGDLWISTNQGLAKLDVGRETFKTYTEAHGLQSNEFNFGAYHKTASGEMLFGGVNGFNAFYPDRIRDNGHVPPVVLTSFLKNNHPVELEDALAETKGFDFTYRDYLVSFDVAALDYAAPEKNRYAYKLEGFDTEWIDLGTLHRITFTNLPAGNFVLRVKASNNDGVWNEDGLRLKLSVDPPPWKSWWAYGLYALALAGAGLAYTRAQKKKLEREAEYSHKLEHEVRERTQELEEKGNELAASNQELQLANSKLAEASVTDSLTGLRNRHYLLTEVRGELAQATEFYAWLADKGLAPPAPVPPPGPLVGRKKPIVPDFVFLMVDLDGFKPLNDTYGHGAGDAALVKTAELLRTACRKTDTIIRWGGDEFLVVGRNADRESAEAIAERIRRAIEEHRFDVGDGQTARLFCSVGFAFYPFLPSRPLLLNDEQVLSIADRALYVAKTSGRNAWVGIYSNESTPSDDLLNLVNEKLDLAVLEGRLDLRSSIHDSARLVWERA